MIYMIEKERERREHTERAQERDVFKQTRRERTKGEKRGEIGSRERLNMFERGERIVRGIREREEKQHKIQREET